MVRYAHYIANTVVSYETVVNYLSGVRRLHELAGYEAPGAQEPNMKLMMCALKLELAHPIKQAEPVTPELLRADHTRMVCFTALLVGFYLFLCKSNLVPDGEKKFDPQKQLTRADVQIGGTMALVVIRWSKTIQYREKELLLPLMLVEDVRICPVFWLRLMMHKIRAGDQEPLFSIPMGCVGVVKPLTYDCLGTQLKHWVGMMQMPNDRYTLHGLQKGGHVMP